MFFAARRGPTFNSNTAQRGNDADQYTIEHRNHPTNFLLTYPTISLPTDPLFANQPNQLFANLPTFLPTNPTNSLPTNSHFCQPTRPTPCQVYMAAGAGPKSNLRLLDEMIAARKEMAGLVGSCSYSQYKAQDASLAQVSALPLCV